MVEKIAIIGGGVAGLAAGYLLHDKYEVTLFEKDDRLGGNAYTLRTKDGQQIDISVFFYSTLEYPNFCKLLKRLRIPQTTWPMEGLSQSFSNVATNHSHNISCDITNPTSTFTLSNLKSLSRQRAVMQNYKKGIRLAKAGKFQTLSLRQALPFLPGLTDELLKIDLPPNFHPAIGRVSSKATPVGAM